MNGIFSSEHHNTVIVGKICDDCNSLHGKNVTGTPCLDLVSVSVIYKSMSHLYLIGGLEFAVN